MGGWERHKNNKSEENRRRSRGDPDFSSFYLIPPHSIHHRCLTRIKYKLLLLEKTTLKTIVNSEGERKKGKASRIVSVL